MSASPIPNRLRELDRTAQSHGWDTMPLRLFHASAVGYLFTRGRVEVDVRADANRIVRAVRTAPNAEPLDVITSCFEAAKDWLSETAPPVRQATRFTRARRALFGSGAELITHDICLHCRGPISNGAIHRRAGDTEAWVHLRDEDWASDVHPAAPAGGPITGLDLPGAWLVAGDPRQQ